MVLHRIPCGSWVNKSILVQMWLVDILQMSISALVRMGDFNICDVDDFGCGWKIWAIWMWMKNWAFCWAIFFAKAGFFLEIFRMIKSCELEVCSMATDFWVDHAKKDPKYWMHMIKGNHSISKYSKVPKQGGTAETASHMVFFSTGNMFTLFS